MTNADKIRGMTDEQLADFLANVIDCWHCPTYKDCYENEKKCDNAVFEWLKQEYKGADND